MHGAAKNFKKDEVQHVFNFRWFNATKTSKQQQI